MCLLHQVTVLVMFFCIAISDWAEILSKKDIRGLEIYYVHFDDCKYSKISVKKIT